MLKNSHPWNVNIQEAKVIQASLASQVITENRFGRLQTIAGADIALDPKQNLGFGGMIVYEYPTLKEIERAFAILPLTFPYIPGLLAFREGPVLLKAFEKLKTKPDLIFFDGQGVAHPRRLGIASHMGLLLDLPTIGCAKSILVGRFENLEVTKGSQSPLIDKEEIVGAALCSRNKVQPIFISVGHKIDLSTSVKITLTCLDGTRIPKPTREADAYVDKIKSEN